MARKEGIELSGAGADRYYAELHSKEGELSNQELSNVAGGVCDESEKEKAGKYELHKESDVCGEHEWSYVVYTGVGAAVLMPYGRQCGNCHYSLTSDKDKPVVGG